MKRFYALFGGLLFLLLLFSCSQFFTGKLFLYNYTDSLPHGIYLMYSGQPQKGELVVIKPEGLAGKLIRERHYLRNGGYLLKHIVGVKGDSVCTEKGVLFVDGVNYGGIDACDREGRPLPRYRFCGRLKDGYVVAVKGMKNSFDSRYYGPIRSEDIVGIAAPLWLFSCPPKQP